MTVSQSGVGSDELLYGGADVGVQVVPGHDQRCPELLVGGGEQSGVVSPAIET